MVHASFSGSIALFRGRENGRSLLLLIGLTVSLLRESFCMFPSLLSISRYRHGFLISCFCTVLPFMSPASLAPLSRDKLRVCCKAAGPSQPNNRVSLALSSDSGSDSGSNLHRANELQLVQTSCSLRELQLANVAAASSGSMLGVGQDDNTMAEGRCKCAHSRAISRVTSAAVDVLLPGSTGIILEFVLLSLNRLVKSR